MIAPRFTKVGKSSSSTSDLKPMTADEKATQRRDREETKNDWSVYMYC
jgi:hypothetical protein